MPRSQLTPRRTRFPRHIAELAADEYEGRTPGTPGEDKSVIYLAAQFRAPALKPGNNGSWFQEVPITSVATARDAQLSLKGRDYSASLSYGDHIYNGASDNASVPVRTK